MYHVVKKKGVKYVPRPAPATRSCSRGAAETVLRDYRARDTAEKLFDAFKTEHGQYRLRTTNDASVQGRFFLDFATLILRAELEKRMRAADLHVSDQAGARQRHRPASLGWAYLFAPQTF
jgi:hypothetical protein